MGTKSAASKAAARKRRAAKPKVRNPNGIVRQLDSHDVREWFATDPAVCISDPAAQKVLRAYDGAYRWWIKFPGKEEERKVRSGFEKASQLRLEEQFSGFGKKAQAAVKAKLANSIEKEIKSRMKALSMLTAEGLFTDQSTSWWQSLRNYLKGFLPTEVVDRFADYLTGFLLVQENETPRSSGTWKDRTHRNNNDFRQLKRLLRRLNGRRGDSGSMLPASTNPPHQESLKSKLIRLMTDELFEVGYSRKLILEKYLPPAWDAIGKTSRDRSFLRIERRSRQRANQAN